MAVLVVLEFTDTKNREEGGWHAFDPLLVSVDRLFLISMCLDLLKKITQSDVGPVSHQANKAFWSQCFFSHHEIPST